MNRLPTWTGYLIIFVFGILCGVLGTRFYVHRQIDRMLHGGPDAVKNAIVHRLSNRLSLTAEQRDEVAAAVKEGQEKFQEVRRRTQPEVDQIIDTTVSRIKSHLNPDQQQKLDQIVERMKKRWRLKDGE